MISIQPTNNNCISLNKTQPVYTPAPEIQSDSKVLNKTLLALATIGLATVLQSCYTDDYLGPDIEELKQKTEDVAKISETAKEEYTNTPQRVDNIMQTLGLLQADTASITNVKTICCTDNKGTRHWTKPKLCFDNSISGEGLSILSDDSEDKKYNYIIKNAPNGGINVFRTFRDGNRTIQNYKLNNDSTITESDVLNGNFLLEKSVYRKQEDGTIIQTFADGSTLIYNQIKNDAEYPSAIGFGGNVTKITNATKETNL